VLSFIKAHTPTSYDPAPDAASQPEDEAPNPAIKAHEMLQDGAFLSRLPNLLDALPLKGVSAKTSMSVRKIERATKNRPGATKQAHQQLALYFGSEPKRLPP
jgi:tRNA C32,U32 (ribose-2'-O)-methylase TrmJ